MSRTLEQKQARRVQEATGCSYQAALQEIRRRIANIWPNTLKPFHVFLKDECDKIILLWKRVP